ncbi:zona pellucida-binding protein 2 isoform X12 [Rattus norvegicus]|uniref:zona pellucida-binding protein 2 isoform X12 n=1 Tax=Rattus norvegicus TaxID=10116 RepID=UPI001916EC6C|nr:zona pellucida-binding protein 2 isoform X6 [Rattus norvegicus]
MLAWALLSAVLWSLAGVGSARSSLFSNEGFVYGTVGHPVKIYVKLHQTSPVLVCMDIDRASKETVDPIYLWIGPNENTLTVNPFAPGWKSMCNSSMDCEDVTNHNILKWSVVLERSVPIWMSPVRPVFLPMSTEPKLAHKRQEQRRTHGCLPLKVEAKIRSHRRAS